MADILNYTPAQNPARNLEENSTFAKHKTNTAKSIQEDDGFLNLPNADGEEITYNITGLTFASNQWIEFEVAGTKNGAFIGLIAAAQAPSTSQNFGIGSIQFTAENTVTVRRGKKVAGEYSGASNTGQTFHNNSKFRLHRSGTFVEAFIDGSSKGSFDMGADNGGGVPGILMQSGTAIQITKVRAGDLTGTGPSKDGERQNASVNTSENASIPMVQSTSEPVFIGGVAPLKYYASNLPTGLTINIDTGTITGFATEVVTDKGVTVWVEDAGGNVASESFNITVNDTGPPSGDTTPPALSSPTASAISTTTISPRVTTNEGNGTARFVVVPDGDSPTIANIKNGQQSSGAPAISSGSYSVTAVGVIPFGTATGLSPNTNYELFFVHTDAAGNDSALSSVGFTTASSDSTAPVISGAAVLALTSSSVTPQFQTDEANGTGYFVVVPDGDAPSAAQIIAGDQSNDSDAIASGNVPVSQTGAVNFSAVTGLTSNTAFELFYVHVDAVGNVSNVISIGFTTASGVQIQTGTIYKNGLAIADGVTLHYTVWPATARTGGMNGVDPVDEGTAVTSGGAITITGIAADDYRLDISEQGASAANDIDYREMVTAS